MGIHEYTVEAYNTAFDSTNRMHDDAVAQTYGFRSGLVPGVDVWAYMTRPCGDRWGEAFLTGSTMEARFVLPVYDGEVVTVRLDDEGELIVTGPDGAVRATGRAALGTDLPRTGATGGHRTSRSRPVGHPRHAGRRHHPRPVDPRLDACDTPRNRSQR